MNQYEPNSLYDVTEGCILRVGWTSPDGTLWVRSESGAARFPLTGADITLAMKLNDAVLVSGATRWFYPVGTVLVNPRDGSLWRHRDTEVDPALVRRGYRQEVERKCEQWRRVEEELATAIREEIRISDLSDDELRELYH